MITPKFKLSQDETHLFIEISAPYAKINDTEISIDENDFRFYSKPYYLRLNLPGKILESENENGTYDYDLNMFKFKFEKSIKGEQFKDLDLLTKLLTPAVNMKSNTLIEEINDGQIHELEVDSGDEWFIEQSENHYEEISLDKTYGYGFAHKKFNVFNRLSDEFSLIIDVPSPDTCSHEERRRLRIRDEDEKFNDEHYLADLYDNEYINDCLLTFKPFWCQINETYVDFDFTDNEIDRLKNLPKKSFILDKQERLITFTSLVDILYAYCYNYRVNCGEFNSEDGWTIAKLSGTLSWFDKFNSFDDAVKCSIRRSLSMPLYRHWKLSLQVFNDLIQIFKIGRKLILKLLLNIHATFNKGDCRYLLNDLYITDYCVWIQYAKEKRIKEISELLDNMKITKEMIGFELECLEMAGQMALDDYHDYKSESSEEDSIEKSMKNLHLESETKKKPLIVELN